MRLETSLLSAVPPAALEVLDRLESAGCKANLVGGCVRDLLLGTLPQDWDICTSAEPQKVIQVFGKDQVRLTGIRQGTVSVRWEGQWFEVTTYRTEGDYQDGRHPSRVSFTQDLEKDLARRDFTINAMALDRGGRLTDPFSGQADLKSRVIRCVGDPILRFQEDGLRILRALRFRSRLGFEIEGRTAAAMDKEKDRISQLSAERVGDEVLGILAGPYAGDTLDRYRNVFLSAVPLLAPTLECTQNCPYHYGTVYQHTVDALKEINRKQADSATVLAVLFHDIGKPQVKTTDSQGTDHFYDHAAAGSELTRRALSNLRYSKKLQQDVSQLVSCHSLQVTPSKASVRRLLNKLGEAQLRRLIEVIRCDTLAHTPLALPRLQTLEEFSDLLEETLKEKSAFSLKQLAVNGKDLLALGIAPGPEMGVILHALLEEVISGGTNDREHLLARAGHLAGPNLQEISPNICPNITFRTYRPEDCGQILRLFYDTVHQVNAAHYSPEQLDVWAPACPDQDRWNLSLLSHHSVLAFQGETLVGFGDIDSTGYLDRLYVHADHQGAGIGSGICDRLEETVPGNITVHASITARPFFEKRGYQLLKEQQVERQGVFFTNYVMVKKR